MRRCDRCGCRLASDQTEQLCSPCQTGRASAAWEASQALTTAIARRHERAHQAHTLGVETIRQAQRWLEHAIHRHEQHEATLVARLDELSGVAAGHRRADLRVVAA